MKNPQINRCTRTLPTCPLCGRVLVEYEHAQVNRESYMSVRGVLSLIRFKEENNRTKMIEMDLGILSLDVILPGLRYSRLCSSPVLLKKLDVF